MTGLGQRNTTGRGAREMADLEYRVENGVGTILLNRPEKKNAFTLQMLHRWAEVYREARTDDSVGAIVLTGAGDTFCSGRRPGESRAGRADPVRPESLPDGPRPPRRVRARGAGQARDRGRQRRGGGCRDGHGADVRHALRRPFRPVLRGLRPRRPGPGGRRRVLPAAPRGHGEGPGAAAHGRLRGRRRRPTGSVSSTASTRTRSLGGRRASSPSGSPRARRW